MNTPQTAFGHRLRAARERCGLSIDGIAASTKINGSLFAELERGELRRWPSGIFRRAFFREYASAIGLDPEPLLPDFLRLFPEDPAMQAEPVVRPETPRMSLAPGRTWTVTAVARRFGIALAELGAVAAVAFLAAAAWSLTFWPAFGVAAATGWAVSTALVGRGALTWWTERHVLRNQARPATARRLRLVTRGAEGSRGLEEVQAAKKTGHEDAKTRRRHSAG